MTAILGYARISTTGQTSPPNGPALAAAGVDSARLFTDEHSGRSRHRPPGPGGPSTCALAISTHTYNLITGQFSRPNTSLSTPAKFSDLPLGRLFRSPLRKPSSQIAFRRWGSDPPGSDEWSVRPRRPRPRSRPRRAARSSIGSVRTPIRPGDWRPVPLAARRHSPQTRR